MLTFGTMGSCSCHLQKTEERLRWSLTSAPSPEPAAYILWKIKVVFITQATVTWIFPLLGAFFSWNSLLFGINPILYAFPDQIKLGQHFSSSVFSLSLSNVGFNPGWMSDTALCDISEAPRTEYPSGHSWDQVKDVGWRDRVKKSWGVKADARKAKGNKEP